MLKFITYSQEPATGPCHEPEETSQRPPTISSRSILILSFRLRLYSPARWFTDKNYVCNLYTHVLHPLPI